MKDKYYLTVGGKFQTTYYLVRVYKNVFYRRRIKFNEPYIRLMCYPTSVEHYLSIFDEKLLFEADTEKLSSSKVGVLLEEPEPEPEPLDKPASTVATEIL